MNFKVKLIDNSHDADFKQNCIYLSKKNFDELNLKDDFVEIILNKNNDENILIKRITKCLVDEKLENDKLCLSSIFWFNLLKEENLNIDTIEEFFINVHISKGEIQFINECHFALVKCPAYNGSINFDELFKKYFIYKRYIYLNDIIAIDTLSYPQIFNEFNMKNTIKHDFVLFKCTSSNSNNGIIDSKICRIYMTGSTNCFIPRQLFSKNYFFNQLNQVVLKNYLEKLKKIVYPFLKVSSISKPILVSGTKGSGKDFIIEMLAEHFKLNLIELKSDDFVNESLIVNENKIKTSFQLLSVYAPCLMHIKDFDIIIKSLNENDTRFVELFKSCLNQEKKLCSNRPIIIIATSNSSKSENTLENNEYGKLFTYSLHIDDLTCEERLEIIKASSNMNNYFLNHDVLDILAKETNGLNFNNLLSLSKKLALTCENSIAIDDEKVFEILKTYKQNIKTKNLLPNIPNVNWSDVGGLQDAKKEILFTIQLCLKYNKLFNSKLHRTGLLFYGPPGTGKTLLAKAIATELKLNFLSVKGPEIMNMYIGQSEQNLRNLFLKAKNVAPSIIFFDELDSIAPFRGKNNSSSGVMDRLVSTLLAELDKLSIQSEENEYKPIFVIGATNRPDLLDTALLRPGRFDKLIYIGLSNNKEQRLLILKALTKKFNLCKDLNLEIIENTCPKNLSGADFYGLCSNAYLFAIERCVDNLEKFNIKKQVEVNLNDFKNALKNLRISITKEDLVNYELLKNKYSPSS